MMRKGTPTFRIIFIASLVVACLGILVARLWWVQVVCADYYLKKVKGGSRVTVRLPAVRGEIKDRNGLPLVENRASFEVDFYLPDIVRAYKKDHARTPLREAKYRKRDRYGNLSEVPEVDIPEIVNETIISRLQKLQLEQDYNAEQLQTHYRNEELIPYTYRQDLDFDTMARLLENNLGLPGLKAEVKPVRYYPYGSLAAHILGYVGAPRDIDKQRQEEAAEGRDYNFFQPDMEGKAQIEKAMDKYLRGEAGVRTLQRDAKNQILENDAQLVPPKAGADVYLTIDARLQYIVEDTLRVAGRAACVIVDVNNGDILAMASVPSFDPNKFVPAIEAKDWVKLTSDETSPLLNRAINAYVPGSTYKTITALAGLRAGVGGNHYNCSGGVSYGNTFMKCWIFGKGAHGTLDLEGGIKNSCNSFFFQYGNAAGIDQIDTVGHMLGLGQLTGVPLSGENPGILDGPEHLREVNPQDKWRPGLTANVSIGQGSVLASPLQMAMVAATIANGGTCYYPRLVDKVVGPDGKIIEQEPAKVRSNLITDGGMTAEQIQHVRHGMWRVVNEEGGTARKARLKDIGVCGKTGTAQNWRIDSKGQKTQDNNTLFIAFAPYDKPKYAICVLIQGGKSGGGVPAPVAAKILDEAFALDKGALNVQVAALEPAAGNFKFIESIDFDREIPAAATADQETVDTVASASANVSDVSHAEAPSIREEPDSQGRVEKPKPKKRGLFDFFNFGGGKKKPKPERTNNAPGFNLFHR
ncbi:MAG: penicillin-binding protein 2 [Terrimicrobiaceae bacterium]|nr:penicillin-binding protein 2 [Terrimicrobiaceae bacterium]